MRASVITFEHFAKIIDEIKNPDTEEERLQESPPGVPSPSPPIKVPIDVNARELAEKLVGESIGANHIYLAEKRETKTWR